MTYDELDKIDIEVLKSYYKRASNMLFDLSGTRLYRKNDKQHLCGSLSRLTTDGWLYMKGSGFRYTDLKCLCSLRSTSLDELELKLTLEGY